jgi:hypothetical protein
MVMVPAGVRAALRPYRWFQCRYCCGVFLVGVIPQVRVADEVGAHARHARACEVALKEQGG